MNVLYMSMTNTYVQNLIPVGTKLIPNHQAWNTYEETVRCGGWLRRYNNRFTVPKDRIINE